MSKFDPPMVIIPPPRILPELGEIDVMTVVCATTAANSIENTPAIVDRSILLLSDEKKNGINLSNFGKKFLDRGGGSVGGQLFK